MIHGHGGNIYHLAQKLGCSPFDITDMSSNVNPLGPPPGLTDFLKENIGSILALPESDAHKAVKAFANRHNIDPTSVLAANGTTQFIYTIPKALETQNALIVGPTYSDYADACAMHKVAYRYSFTDESRNFEPDMETLEKDIFAADTVFICNPNNPTGVLMSSDKIESLCRTFPQKFFIIDESYLPFVRHAKSHSILAKGIENAVVLNSMSKIFRVPGLRIGFISAHNRVIEKLAKYALPWSVNSIAQMAVIYLMTQNTEIDAFIQKTRTFLENERKAFATRLELSQHIKLFHSETSFILAKLSDHTADDVCGALAAEGILIRNCSNFAGLSEQYIRVSLKTSEINRMLADKLSHFCL